MWWFLLLGVHAVVAFFNALTLYGYYYWNLQDTYLNVLLVSFQIGLPLENGRAVAIVHIIMAVLHGFCILLMLGGSIWNRSLAFTPWASCTAEVKTEEVKSSDRTRSRITRSFTTVYAKVSDRHGLLGVNGRHFHTIQLCRELVETTLQTRQAYRMSMLLRRALLNRIYVVLIVMNCWAPAIVNTWLFKGDEACKRYTIILSDCALNLISYVGVAIIVIVGYTGDYDLTLWGFDYLTWYNELQMVIVVSWMDLATRSIFSLSLIATTTNMKELLQRLPHKKNRIGQSVFTAPSSFDIATIKTIPSTRGRFFCYDSKLLAQFEKLTLHSGHILFGIWGAVVLAFHIKLRRSHCYPNA